MNSIPDQMTEAGVAGVSLAIVDHGEVNVTSFGFQELSSPAPIGESTVFTAASLSKPVVSYIALQLVDEGVFDLDVLMSEYVQEGIPPDVTSSPITARHILTHTSGLPNTHNDATLKSHYSPGSRFSYSSIGFTYLQRALHAVTNQPLEALAEQFVFHPLGMNRSSFLWQDRFADDFAVPHQFKQVLEKHRPTRADASGSLQTCAADYAKFVVAVLEGML